MGFIFEFQQETIISLRNKSFIIKRLFNYKISISVRNKSFLKLTSRQKNKIIYFSSPFIFLSSFFIQVKVSSLITCSILQASLEAVSSLTPIAARNS